jgi:endoglucanase
VPGVFGTDYTYPTHSEIDYYAAKGMGVVRLPFLWERIQRSEFGQLDAAELGRLDDVVSYATGRGLKIEIEPHNYGYGFGALIGGAQTPNAAFADLWGKLAFHFQSNSGVIFGLMNEPHDQSASAWLGSANAAIAAIRGAGAMQEILVPGSYWDGAWTWTSTDNAAVVGAGVQDSAHNFAFEVHQYLDADGSGTHAGVVSATIGVERLTAITQWAEATGNRLFLGEVGVTTDQTSLTAFDGMLSYMQQHTGAWQGVTYWAGGPWWGNYMFSIEPQNGVDKPQMGILLQHLSAPGGDYNGTPGPDTFSATGNLLQVFGNDGNDQLYVVGNQNRLSGGNGNDTLHADGASIPLRRCRRRLALRLRRFEPAPRRRRQRCVRRRSHRRRRDRERRRRHRHRLCDGALPPGGQRGKSGAAGQRRSAGLRQRREQCDLRQCRKQPAGRRVRR